MYLGVASIALPLLRPSLAVDGSPRASVATQDSRGQRFEPKHNYTLTPGLNNASVRCAGDVRVMLEAIDCSSSPESPRNSSIPSSVDRLLDSYGTCIADVGLVSLTKSRASVGKAGDQHYVYQMLALRAYNRATPSQLHIQTRRRTTPSWVQQCRLVGSNDRASAIVPPSITWSPLHV